MDSLTRSVDLGAGRTLSIEYGRLARQADGAVMLRLGDVMMLATVVSRKDADPTLDFLPLTVDYRESYASTGKFPGGFFKREGRSNEHEILTSRIVDRTLRPMFPKDYHAETQVIVTLHSSDGENPGDAMACFAASCALMCSDIPFPEPVATVRIARTNGEFIINPSYEQYEQADLDLIVGGTAKSIVMVEGEMDEVSEEVMLEALKHAHETIQSLCQFQEDLRREVGKTTREYEVAAEDENLKARVEALAGEKITAITNTPRPKQERSEAYSELREAVLETLVEEYGEAWTDDHARQAKGFYGKLQKQAMRNMILESGVRLDGRKTDEVRDIWCQAGYLPRVHGSALFTRGETQSLSTITLGSKLDEQTIDYATVEGTKRFMLQYNFPPFSTGEAKFLRGPSRREVGHGNLAERALKKVVPEDNEYTIRIVSDILESNGSSSMATVCAGCMALMDAGIHVRGAVSGIAMGLIEEGDSYAILSDILGDEDFLGDMDFKVAGTSKGLTACQMDMKLKGLNFEVLQNALEQSKRGRAHILNKMLEELPEPRQELSAYAPRLITFEIPVDTIGGVIGPGGKVIQEIQRTTGATVSIEEMNNAGYVTISSPDLNALEAAKKRIDNITYQPQVDDVFDGTVVALKDAGAIVEFMGGSKDGWLHISEIDWEHVPSVEEAVQIGDEFQVKVIEVDAKTGRFRLSRKAMLPKPENYVERPPRDNRGGGGGGNRGRGGGGRGDKKFNRNRR